MSSIDVITMQPRAYHRRNVRWYHSHMIDWLMAHPGGSLGDLALHVGKTQATVSAIFRSDMFQAALAKRKSEYAQRQDLILSKKLTEVAVRGLDTILAVLETKKDKVDPDFLATVTTGALDRLGYSTQQKGAAAAVQVNINQNNATPVPTPVSVGDLNEARQLMQENQRRIAEIQPRIIEGEVLPPLKEAAPVNGPPKELA